MIIVIVFVSIIKKNQGESAVSGLEADLKEKEM